MRYVPRSIPNLSQNSPFDSLREFLSSELKNIANMQFGISNFEMIQLKVLTSAPHNPVHGLIVYADGTSWNPGSGEGVYRYNSGGTWSFVG